MILRLTIISTEVEDFVLEVKIDADSTFADLHRLILSHCNYEKASGQRFYICDEGWNPTLRIRLEEDSKNASSDEDIYLMEDTRLSDFLEDEGQRLAYRFGPERHRLLLIELTETLFGERVSAEGKITRSHGTAPAQYMEEEVVVPAPATNSNPELMEEEFFGEEGFEADEMDMEGFEIEER